MPHVDDGQLLEPLGPASNGAELETARNEPDDADRGLSRRRFLRDMGLFTAAALSIQSSGFLGTNGARAEALTPDLMHDTFYALIAFVVPGPDPYSVAQGASTPEPGGLDADVAEALIASMDASAPFVPQFSVTVAGILNSIAEQVHPGVTGPFPSPFARLSFAEKATVFAVMDSLEPLKPLAGVLPAVVAFLAYSEAGVFDPVTRRLTARPVGWTISTYEGVADGRDEFHGYFQNRRSVR